MRFSSDLTYSSRIDDPVPARYDGGMINATPRIYGDNEGNEMTQERQDWLKERAALIRIKKLYEGWKEN